jgi:hypothetical protein
LCPTEMAPGRVGASLRRGRGLQGLEDRADGGRADPAAELEQLSLDPLVSPAELSIPMASINIAKPLTVPGARDSVADN